jgi:hypothetical protein
VTPPFNFAKYRLAALAAGMPEADLARIAEALGEQGARQPASTSLSSIMESVKMGAARQPAGSSIEAKIKAQLEFDDRVAGYFSQSLTFTMPMQKPDGSGTGYRHRPDIIVLWHPELRAKQSQPLVTIIEAKADDYVRARTTDKGGPYLLDEGTGRWRNTAAEKVARDLWGADYEVWTEYGPNQQLVQNIDYAWDFLSRKPKPVPQDVLNALKSFVAQNPGTTMHQAELEIAGLDRGRILLATVSREVAFRWKDEPLNNPPRARLYATEAIADFYAAGDRLRSVATSSGTPPLLVTGERIEYDGVEYGVFENTGSEVIRLRDLAGGILAISRSNLIELHQQGRVRSLGMPTEREQRARELMRDVSDEQLNDALKKLAVIEPRLNGQVRRAALGDHRLSSTEKLWLGNAREALEQTGNPLLGLIGWQCRRGCRKPRISLKEEELIKDSLQTYHLKARKTKKDSYSLYKRACTVAKLCPVSYKTFNGRLAKLGREKAAELRDGRMAAGGVAAPSTAPRSLPAVPQYFMHVVHIDETPFDLAMVDPRFEDLRREKSRIDKAKHVLGTATLAVMFDAYSRSVLAFIFTFDAPSYVSTTLPLLRQCVIKWRRLPRWIVTDNGPAFQHEYIDCSEDMRFNPVWRPAMRARMGAQIERFIGLSQQDVAHAMEGSTQILAEFGRVAPSHLPSARAIYFPAAVMEILGRFFYEEYDCRGHSGLAGRSPREVREESPKLHGARAHMEIIPDSAFDILTLPKVRGGTQKIQPHKGVQVFGFYYWIEAFKEAQNRSVEVRWDPINITRVFVHLNNKWIAAYNLASLVLGKQLSPVHLALVTRMMRRDQKEHRKGEAERVCELNEILRKLHRGDGDPIEMLRLHEVAKSNLDNFPNLQLPEPAAEERSEPAGRRTERPAGLPSRNK